MKVQAVIFDCDGVVVDTEPVAFTLLQHEFLTHGLPMTRDDIERELKGLTMANVRLEAIKRGARLAEDWVARFYDKLYRALGSGVALMPGLVELLDKLDAGITLGQHPQVMARFHGIYSGQDMPHPKPAPDLYLHAAVHLGVDPRSCVVIEDSAIGARAARAAGMHCYGLAPRPDYALAAEGAHRIAHLSDLPELLGL